MPNDNDRPARITASCIGYRVEELFGMVKYPRARVASMQPRIIAICEDPRGL